MKCPNCGADMKEGSLYCEQCGEDIHIVPDFEPELEYNMEQTLSGIVNDIHEKSEKQENIEEEMQENAEKAPYQDWDGVDAESGRHPNKGYKIFAILAVILFIFVAGGVSAIILYRYYSVEYQTMMASRYVSAEDYDDAITYYNRALELEPDNVNLKLSLAEVYFLKNNKIEYEYLLREIVNDKNAGAEQLESAYGKLIAIYRAREDYKTINEILLASGNESIISKYQNYIATVPEFSVKEGSYTSIQPLKLTNFGTGKIYFTLDGTDPTENSSLYTAPILLEDGDYVVKAYYVNDLGIASDIVTKNYSIEIEMLPSPEVSAVSGNYEFPINIEILSEADNVYYTKDGSIPDEHSSIYTGAIPMPIGKTTFHFIRIEDGRKSEVVERIYTLTLHTNYTSEEAVEDVIQYTLDIGKINNRYGDFDDTDSVYLYEYQYVTNINGIDDFYIVSEILCDSSKILTKTGNHFAVNVYTREIFKLQMDEYGNFKLVEIEKGPQE